MSGGTTGNNDLRDPFKSGNSGSLEVAEGGSH